MCDSDHELDSPVSSLLFYSLNHVIMGSDSNSMLFCYGFYTLVTMVSHVSKWGNNQCFEVFGLKFIHLE